MPLKLLPPPGGSTRSMAGYWSCLLSEAAARSTLRDAGTGKDAGTSLAAGDGSLTDATLFCCSASTESTGSTVEGGFLGKNLNLRKKWKG